MGAILLGSFKIKRITTYPLQLDALISTVFASEPSVNLSKVQAEKYDYCQDLHIFVYNNLKKVRKLFKMISLGFSEYEVQNYIQENMIKLTENESIILFFIVNHIFKEQSLYCSTEENNLLLKSNAIGLDTFKKSMYYRKLYV